MFKNLKKQNKTSLRKSASGLRQSAQRGFTLVELLVTITMFVIVTGVVLLNSNKFDSTVLLHNFAYDVALTIKQAQTYGVNVRENSLGTFNLDSSGVPFGYGVYFNTTDPTLLLGGSNTNFILFDDINKDNKYADGDVTKCPTNDSDNIECIQKYSMRRGTFIKSMCAGSKDECSGDNNNTNQLSILFLRPNLNAIIYKGDLLNSDGNTYAKIVVSSSDGATSSIVVTSIGQIYTK